MIKMKQKYFVTLTDEERAYLKDLIAKGRTQGYRIKHAQILLKLGYCWVIKMKQKYFVTLTDEERAYLKDLIAKGRTQGYRIKHAQILLKLDEIPENRKWSYTAIQDAYHATPYTISQIAKRFVTGGLEAALGRKEQINRHRKVDCSNNEWREVSRSHSTKTVANVKGRTEL